jgi:DNA invertase Pin-like site-specific DNA recombinase
MTDTQLDVLLRVAMYLRISLDKTGEALGPDRQRNEAMRQLKFHHLADGPIEEYQEPGSLSASKKRPDNSEYARLYRDALAGKFDVLIVWDIDRLTRIPREIEDWLDLCENRGLRIITMDGECDTASANGRMFLRIKAAVARHEVEHKSARQKASHQQRAESGKPWWTTRPFGFNKDGTHHAVEAKILRKLYRGILAERTLSDLTRWLNDEAIRSTRGNQWTSAHLRVLLLAPRNAGIRVRNGIEVGPGNWKPIIPEEQFRAVEHILRDEARYRGGGGPRKGLLVGVARCGACGATVRQGAVGRRRADGTYRKAYICVANQCVSHTLEFVDDAVGALLVARLRDPDFLTPLLPKSESMDDLRAEKRALKEAMDELGEDYADGLIARPEFRKLRERQNRQMELLDERVQIATNVTKLSKLPPLDVLARDWFKEGALPVEVKRLAIETFMDVTLNVRGKGCRTWEADRDLTIGWVDSLEDESALLGE